MPSSPHPMRIKLALVVALTVLTWTFFSIMTPESPLGVNATVVVLMVWTAIVSVGSWVQGRVRARSKP